MEVDGTGPILEQILEPIPAPMPEETPHPTLRIEEMMEERDLRMIGTKEDPLDLTLHQEDLLHQDSPGVLPGVHPELQLSLHPNHHQEEDPKETLAPDILAILSHMKIDKIRERLSLPEAMIVPGMTILNQSLLMNNSTSTTFPIISNPHTLTSQNQYLALPNPTSMMSQHRPCQGEIAPRLNIRHQEPSKSPTPRTELVDTLFSPQSPSRRSDHSPSLVIYLLPMVWILCQQQETSGSMTPPGTRFYTTRGSQLHASRARRIRGQRTTWGCRLP